jgi:hypothetical protein
MTAKEPKPPMNKWLRRLNFVLPVFEARAAWKLSREQISAIKATTQRGKALLAKAAETEGEAVAQPPTGEAAAAAMIFAGRVRWWFGFVALSAAVWQSTMFVLTDAGWLARVNIGVAAVMFVTLGCAFCLQGAAMVRSAKEGAPVRLRDVARTPLWWMPY